MKPINWMRLRLPCVNYLSIGGIKPPESEHSKERRIKSLLCRKVAGGLRADKKGNFDLASRGFEE